MKKLGVFFHAEIVSWFVGLNIVLINLQVLGVHWLTDARVKAIAAIVDVAFGAVVRALVTPTPLTPPAPVLAVPSAVSTSGRGYVMGPVQQSEPHREAHPPAEGIDGIS